MSEQPSVPQQPSAPEEESVPQAENEETGLQPDPPAEDDGDAEEVPVEPVAEPEQPEDGELDPNDTYTEGQG